MHGSLDRKIGEHLYMVASIVRSGSIGAVHELLKP